MKRPDRTVVTLEGGLVRAGNTNYDCDGERISQQTHSQFVGQLRLDHEAAEGVVTGAGGSISRGEVSAASGFEEPLDGSPYRLASTGLYVGFDALEFGLKGGGSLVASADELYALPWAQVRAGRWDGSWLQVEFGALHPLPEGVRLWSLGIGARGLGERSRMEGGIAVDGSVRPLVDRDVLSGRRLIWGAVADDLVDTHFRFWLNGDISDVLQWNLAAVLGPQPSLMVGVGYVPDLEEL